MIGWLAAALAGLGVAGFGWRASPVSRLVARDGRRPQLPGLVTTVVVAAGLGSLAVAAGVSPLASAVGLAIVALGLAVRRQRQRSAVVERRRALVADIAFATAAELRAGRGPGQAVVAAWSSASRADPELGEVLGQLEARVRVGQSPGAVLIDAGSLPGLDRLRFLAAALAVVESSGGRVAEVLDRIGFAIDGDEELRQELDAAMAGPRASMVMLAALPVLGIGLGQAMGAAPLRLLLHRPLGWGLLVAGLVLDLAGVGMVRLITRSALR